MDEARDKIERELESINERLRQLGGAVVIKEFPGGPPNTSPLPDLLEKVQVHADREVRLATRSLLVDRANRLVEALERVREDKYGICEQCGEGISPARLKVMPEATTCVRCQDGLERRARPLAHGDL